MFYFSKNSKKKIYHTKDCGYVKLISEKNLETCADQEELFNKGYVFCNHCSPAGKYYHKYQHFIDNLPENASEYTITLFDGEIEIVSPNSKYLLTFPERKKMRLYHKNTFEVGGVETEVAGYHLQKSGDYSLSTIMSYIVTHDEYRKNHPVQYSPQLSEKIRIDSLMNSIPRKHFKASHEKSEHMQKIESYHRHLNKQNPQKSGGGTGQKTYRRKKKQEKRSKNSKNASRVNYLLNTLDKKR